MARCRTASCGRRRPSHCTTWPCLARAREGCHGVCGPGSAPPARRFRPPGGPQDRPLTVEVVAPWLQAQLSITPLIEPSSASYPSVSQTLITSDSGTRELFRHRFGPCCRIANLLGDPRLSCVRAREDCHGACGPGRPIVPLRKRLRRGPTDSVSASAARMTVHVLPSRAGQAGVPAAFSQESRATDGTRTRSGVPLAG